MKKLIIVIFIVIVLGVLFSTNPEKSSHYDQLLNDKSAMIFIALDLQKYYQVQTFDDNFDYKSAMMRFEQKIEYTDFLFFSTSEYQCDSSVIDFNTFGILEKTYSY